MIKERNFRILSLLLLVILLNTLIVAAATISVPTDFGSIQSAINSASDGDTINVDPGTYNENIILDKRLLLNSSFAIIDCLGAGAGISITGNDSIIQGFEITNCETGIEIAGRNNKIKNNSIHDNNAGIEINNSLANNITISKIFNNTLGLLNNDPLFVANATHNFWGACDGPSGTGLNGTGDAVSLNVSVSPWIGICVTNKTGGACVVEKDNVTLTANIASLLNINRVWISYTINGTNYNKTAIPQGPLYSYTINSSQLQGIGGQNIDWNYYANDSYGNIFANGLMTFYVRNTTSLNVTPSIPDGLNGWYVTEPLFTLTADSTFSTILYQWDSFILNIYTAPFNLDGIPNAPPKESAGILDLNYWSEFSCGNESKNSALFMVDLVSPNITALLPEPNSTAASRRPLIRAYIDELYQSNSGVNKSTITMTLDGSPILMNISTPQSRPLDAVVSHIPTSDLSIGWHNVSVFVIDNAGRNSSITWSFNISSGIGFNLTVILPNSTLSGTRSTQFNISTSDFVSKIEFINYNDNIPQFKTLCSNCNGYGFASKRNINLNEGDNTLTVRATDLFANIMEVNLTVFVDSKLPRISRILPRGNSVINGSFFFIKYIEDNLQQIKLFFNPEYNLSLCQSGSANCSTSIDLTAFNNQSITFFFNVTDPIRTVQSRATTVFVDTVSPTLTVYSPANMTTNLTRITFNMTSSEPVILEYLDNSASVPRWKRLCSNCLSHGYSSKKTQFIAKGNHSLTIRARDKAGNSNTENIFLLLN